MSALERQPPTGPIQRTTGFLCSKYDLLDGSHVIAVRATVIKAQIFWIDTLQYVPSPIVALDQKVVRVESSDPQMVYSSGWSQMDFKFQNLTSQQGATLTFDFIGASLMWFGTYVRRALRLGPSTATYSIDGQTPTNFVVNSSTGSGFNTKFFETEKLSPGSHRLSVMYTSATNQSAPLALSYLLIQNGTVGSSGSSGLKSGSGSNTKVGPIVGGVVGSVVVICSIVFGAILLRRKKKKADDKGSSKILEPDFAAGPVSPGSQFSLQPQRAEARPNYTYTGSHPGPGPMPSYCQTEFQFQSIMAVPSTSSGNTFPINTNSSNVVTQHSPSTPCPQ